jgi:hypothetical protein
MMFEESFVFWLLRASYWLPASKRLNELEYQIIQNVGFILSSQKGADLRNFGEAFYR